MVGHKFVAAQSHASGDCLDGLTERSSSTPLAHNRARWPSPSPFKSNTASAEVAPRAGSLSVCGRHLFTRLFLVLPHRRWPHPVVCAPQSSVRATIVASDAALAGKPPLGARGKSL